MFKKLRESIEYKNISKNSVRSMMMAILIGILSFTIFVGSLMVISLKRGLTSLNERLGADVMVVPYEATTKSEIEDIVLQGNTGYFYMDKAYVDEIEEIDGIERLTTQFYLATAKSGCCSLPVQIIGIDPETDFTVMPWIKKSSGSGINNLEVYVGNDLNAFVGDTLTFYGTDVTVVGKLDRTGTTMDTTVYTNNETVKMLIKSAYENKFNEFDFDPDNVVSCVLLDVADGYSPEEVENSINLYVKKVVAYRTGDMISGITSGLEGVAAVIMVLIIMIWVLAVAIITISFLLITSERKKEFAVMRVIGYSSTDLKKSVWNESAMISLFGGICGVLIGLIFVLPFSNLIENVLGLPYLLPSFVMLIAIVLLSIIATLLSGTFAGSFSALHISKIDTAKILRGE